jgi:prefoldin subunit 5
MDEFLSGDSELNKLEIKANYIQNIVEFLESVMNQIKARDWQIRNSIEWKKFISGA